ncbi:hypothetical protein [Rhizobium sp. NZLR1]|uniref:hypothetical protein n=1 Tax=Rhizobium sp. NZLR1 TaxID=2731096 RepID=UPI001A98EA25|nr:hypothetical protein [Rhizobium sp. NZLR1]MBX5201022.1 hypothetical protein [Rhizobium sp. NZLR1]QSZ21547.1 hypothetical protein J3O30_02970 [Rhizobium sp. NZLR1]
MYANARTLAALMVLFSVQGTLQANASGRLILIGLYDTADPTAGVLIKRASQRVNAFFDAASDALGEQRQVSQFVLDGADFSVDSLRAVVNPLPALGADDSVILVYIGHGFDDPLSPFQMLNIRDQRNDKDSLPAQRIIDALSSRTPGTLILLFEACNVERQASTSAAAEETPDPRRIKALLDAHFGLAIASTREGEYSYVGKGGGVSSNRLLSFFSKTQGSLASATAFQSFMSQPLGTGAPLQPEQHPTARRLW